MSGVVLRCPNCGTTRAATGECDACHEAQVRYFCTNHKPGRWLDAPACTQCGSRFGDPVRARPAPAPVAAPTPAPVPRTPRTPAPASTTPRSPYASPRGPAIDEDAWGRDGGPSPVEEEVDARDERVDARFASWQELLWAIARARRSRARTVPDPEIAPRGPGVSGCLLRLVMLMVFLFIALVMAPFLFGGFLFGIY